MKRKLSKTVLQKYLNKELPDPDMALVEIDLRIPEEYSRVPRFQEDLKNAILEAQQEREYRAMLKSICESNKKLTKTNNHERT